MDCEQAGLFVSMLHDGESVPPEAAQHIMGCPACTHRLRDYAEIAAELRLLASAEGREVEDRIPLPSPPRIRGQWLYALTRGVSVPRFAVVLSVMVIIGLAVGLQLVRAQSRGPWFEYEVGDEDSGDAHWSVHALEGPGSGRLGGASLATDRTSDPDGKNKTENGCVLYTHEIRKDAVFMGLRAYSVNGWLDDIGRKSAIQKAPEREFWYKPPETLRIPVNGFGDLKLTGRISEERPIVSFTENPLFLKENEVALRGFVLVKEEELIPTLAAGSAMSASGNDPAVAFYAPKEGLFVLALHPFEGAIEGRSYWGQVQFNLDGADYKVLSVTPITGGSQPRSVWIRRYWISGGEDSPVMSGDLSHLLQEIKMKK
ncbi:MAG: hypothetical protein LAO31_17155 [Acidobacteriia bacterium]|nr:hypothetical protein [Terriglobia bacterium]